MPPSTQAHLITIPHSVYPHFIVNLTALSGSSLHVWCGIASSSLVTSLSTASSSSNNDQDGAGEGEDELTRALRESGRLSEPEPGLAAVQPPGLLASEWAVAINLPHAQPIATSIFRTNADLATGMARRIAHRLNIPQLFLSLDIPPPLLPSSSTPQNPEDSFALLLLEKGIRDACKTVLKASTI
ncbi:hypothetical protein ACQY0O_002138 [Thecaphora frezii]